MIKRHDLCICLKLFVYVTALIPINGTVSVLIGCKSITTAKAEV